MIPIIIEFHQIKMYYYFTKETFLFHRLLKSIVFVHQEDQIKLEKHNKVKWCQIFINVADQVYRETLMYFLKKEND